jgi:hypothetical protein
LNYFVYTGTDNSNQLVSGSFGVNPNNGDILASVATYGAYTTPATSQLSQMLGDDWLLGARSIRQMVLAKYQKVDAKQTPAGNAYTKQYAPNTTYYNHAENLITSVSDSTYYILCSMSGESADAWVVSYNVKTSPTVTSSKLGWINKAIIDSARVNTATIGTANVMTAQMGTGNVFATFFKDNANKGMLKSFTCTSLGDLGTLQDSLIIHNYTTYTNGSIVYAGGNYVGLVWGISSSGGSMIGTTDVDISTGAIGATVNSRVLAGGTGVKSPNIFRLAGSQYYAVTYVIDGAHDPSWLKTYSINSSTGALGGTGATTIACIDSLRLVTDQMLTPQPMCRIGASDYYLVLLEQLTAGTWKVKSVNINSANGDVGSALIDSLTLTTAKTGAFNQYGSIQRLGATNNYLANISYQSGNFYVTFSADPSDGTIGNATIDSWASTSYSNDIINVGGDIYLMDDQNVTDQDGYLRTLVLEDSTGGFIPTSTKGYVDQYEYDMIGGTMPGNALLLGKVAGASSQTAYVLVPQPRGAGLSFQTYSINSELDVYGWPHKVWGTTPAKIWGDIASLVKKIMGI